MRKFDKKLNILKANLLSEQRYAETKDPLNEGWKTNVAAGLATLAGGAGANAQAQSAPQKPNVQNQVQGAIDKGFGDKVANPFNADDTFANTKSIVAIQSGVQDGRTGKSGVYVYHKLPTDPSFDVSRDREIVYTENLPTLMKTQEYKAYMAKKQGGQQAQSQNQVAMREGEKKN